jgi:hypothetical protein
LGKNYNTVSIIGCQSSGKSTLLNNLFQTSFEVMSDDKGRGQTTKGIWSSLCKKNKILILDVEGTDSKERGDDRHKFENCASLFGLALADLLIVNMWTVDIGRYTASNYGVLKTIFEMNLKLFQQECAKKILFVLRDFNLNNDNKEKITDLILKDIYNIWSEVQKPERYKDYTPDKFFEFEFVTLPHYYYNSQEFDNEVSILRSRFSKDNDNYLFSHSNQEKNVLSQDLNMYFSKIWSTILSDKDLNIVSLNAFEYFILLLFYFYYIT